MSDILGKRVRLYFSKRTYELLLRLLCNLPLKRANTRGGFYFVLKENLGLKLVFGGGISFACCPEELFLMK